MNATPWRAVLNRRRPPSATMPIDERLKASIAGLIQVERHSRASAIRKALQGEQGKAAGQGALGAGRYGLVQDELCAAELCDRARRWIGVAIRVFAEVEEQWTSAAGTEMGYILSQELDGDFRELLDELSSVTAPHGLLSVGGQLSTANARARTSIGQEIALLVLRHDRRRVPLVEQLSAPRYALVLSAWRKSQSYLAATPPDEESAVSAAVGAVEAIARLLVGDPKPTLGECIKQLRQRRVIEAPLLKGFEELWGVASETEGVRHYGGIGGALTPDVAQYLIATAAACVGLLLAHDLTSLGVGAGAVARQRSADAPSPGS